MSEPAANAPSAIERLRAHPSAILLFAQLISLAIHPWLDGSQRGRVLFGAIALVVVPLAVNVVASGPATTWIGVALAGPAILLSLVGIALGVPSLVVLASVLEAALYFYAAYGLILYMLKDRFVSTDDLFAAAATFTLLAWGFAYAYLVCQSVVRDAFTGFVDPTRPRTFLELLSLSVSTLSGVGNGDVIPLSPFARVLTMLEQFAGVGYVATVVSRLIGLGISRR